MNTIKIDKKQVLMIAHRGVSGLEVENTCPAFIAAAVKTYYGIETDVHVTKDGRYLICHDDNILRVTGVDMIIEESNYEDLKKQVVLEKDFSTRSDLVLPDLSDYLRICKKYQKEAILELKNTMDIKHIMGIVTLVKTLGWFENTTFISFSSDNLVNLKAMYPNAKAQFLTDKITDEVVEFLLKYNLDLDVYYKSLNKEFIQKVHQKGIKVNCWTVDMKEDAYALIEMGVDMITSNILE